MNFDYTSVSDLQRKTKSVLSGKPFQVILNNNQPNGMILSQEVTQALLDSGILEQVREELFELRDPETLEVIRNYRAGKSSPISFEEFNEKHGL